MRIINKIYNLESNLNKNILLISDIHYKDKNDLNRLNLLLKEIKKINPNYICIPGDLTDKSIIKDENELINWLKKLSKICKVIVSLGNHEFYINKSSKGLNRCLLEKIRNVNNLYLLDNENIIIDNINFIGMTLEPQYYEEYNLKDTYKYLDKLKTYKKYYNVLLCHSPLNICDKELLSSKNIELILCGHMHGGVMPNIFRKIIKHRGLISPKMKLFPKYAYGHIKIENSNIIISSGIRVIPFKYINNLFSMEIVKISI